MLRQLQHDNAARRRARGDVLLVMPDGPLVVAVCVVHSAADVYVREAAITDGAATALRGARKEAKYLCVQAGGGYAFELISVETCGGLDEQALTFLERLRHIAAESGKVDKDFSMANTLKERSVGLCRGNAMILTAGQY